MDESGSVGRDGGRRADGVPSAVTGRGPARRELRVGRRAASTRGVPTAHRRSAEARAERRRVASPAPASSSESTASVPPPPHRARSVPSRVSIAGVDVGGVAGSSTRVRSTRAGMPPASCGRRDTAAPRRAPDCGSHGASRFQSMMPSSGPASAEIRALTRGPGGRRGAVPAMSAGSTPSSVDLRGDRHLVEHLARGVVGKDRHRRSARRCRRRRASPSCSAASRRSRARRAAPPS